MDMKRRGFFATVAGLFVGAKLKPEVKLMQVEAAKLPMGIAVGPSVDIYAHASGVLWRTNAPHEVFSTIPFDPETMEFDAKTGAIYWKCSSRPDRCCDCEEG